MCLGHISSETADLAEILLKDGGLSQTLRMLVVIAPGVPRGSQNMGEIMCQSCTGQLVNSGCSCWLLMRTVHDIGV